MQHYEISHKNKAISNIKDTKSIYLFSMSMPPYYFSKVFSCGLFITGIFISISLEKTFIVISDFKTYTLNLC